RYRWTPPGRRRISTRTGICSFGVAMSSRSSAAPLASPKCRPPRLCWKRSGEKGLFLLQRPVRDHGSALQGAEPADREIVALTRQSDRAVGTAATFVSCAFGDDLNIKHVRFRRSGTGELPGAVEIRIFRLCPPGIDRELELVRRLAADLSELAAPVAIDVRAGRGRALLSFCCRLVFGGGGILVVTSG